MDSTISLWLNFNGNLRCILRIPATRVLSLCKYPIKWVFFVANLAFGCINPGCLYKAYNGQDQGNPLRLRRVSLEEMESPNFATNYYFFGPTGGSVHLLSLCPRLIACRRKATLCGPRRHERPCLRPPLRETSRAYKRMDGSPRYRLRSLWRRRRRLPGRSSSSPQEGQ